MPCKRKVNLDMNMLQSAAGNSGKTEPALTDQDEGCFSSFCFVLFWRFCLQVSPVFYCVRG